MGANVIIGADFETSDILQDSVTIFVAWGTTVIVKPAKITE